MASLYYNAVDADMKIETRKVLNERILTSERINFAGMCKPMSTKGCRWEW
jgi:hypothetical protein